MRGTSDGDVDLEDGDVVGVVTWFRDVDNDGQYEVRTTARFALGCGGTPFTETINLKIVDIIL